MFSKIKLLVASALAAVAFMVPVLVPHMVGAAGTCLDSNASSSDINTNLNCGACLNTTSSTCGDTDPGTRVNSILTTVINIFSLVVGVVSVIFVIVGGLKFITSSGDAGNVSSAQKTIIYALVGLVVVALAQIIVRFVLSKTAAS